MVRKHCIWSHALNVSLPSGLTAPRRCAPLLHATSVLFFICCLNNLEFCCWDCSAYRLHSPMLMCSILIFLQPAGYYGVWYCLHVQFPRFIVFLACPCIVSFGGSISVHEAAATLATDSFCKYVRSVSSDVFLDHCQPWVAWARFLDLHMMACVLVTIHSSLECSRYNCICP